MNYVLITVLSISLLFSVCSAGEKPELKDQRDKESYSLGYQFGDSVKKQGVDINLEVYTRGVRDALGGKESVMRPEEIRETLTSLRQRVMATRYKALKEQAAKNLADGKAFLAENAKKEGVITLPSGLQYRVLAMGSGRMPMAGDNVTVHYRGTFIDGTEFDSSYSRGKPETVQVDGVIPGWTEALQLMKERARWQLFVPPELAYGEHGMGSRIGPNRTLVFEVELISID